MKGSFKLMVLTPPLKAKLLKVFPVAAENAGPDASPVVIQGIVAEVTVAILIVVKPLVKL